MAAGFDAGSTARFGLNDFHSMDASGRPILDDDEELAGDYSHVTLALGEHAQAASGHLYISSRWDKTAV